MRRILLAALLLLGCNGQEATIRPSTIDEFADGSTITCCTPSKVPACCMQTGGLSYNGLCPLSCDVPDPNLPGWELTKDEMGCAIWKRPQAPTLCTANFNDGGDPCSPSSVDGYVATALVPPRTMSAACSSAEVKALYDACVGMQASFTACAAAREAGGSCGQCVWSVATDSQWAPLVASGFAVNLNVAGCVALVEHDSSASGCAARIAATTGCEARACSLCPNDGQGSLVPHETCVQSADVGECRSFLDAECDLADAGSECIVTDESTFASFVNVFCHP